MNYCNADQERTQRYHFQLKLFRFIDRAAAGGGMAAVLALCFFAVFFCRRPAAALTDLSLNPGALISLPPKGGTVGVYPGGSLEFASSIGGNWLFVLRAGYYNGVAKVSLTLPGSSSTVEPVISYTQSTIARKIETRNVYLPIGAGIRYLGGERFGNSWYYADVMLNETYLSRTSRTSDVSSNRTTTYTWNGTGWDETVENSIVKSTYKDRGKYKFSYPSFGAGIVFNSGENFWAGLDARFFIYQEVLFFEPSVRLLWRFDSLPEIVREKGYYLRPR